MSHRFRSRVWRELPFSARRAILVTLRRIDRIDAWLTETWQSLHESPAWLFVAAVGLVGIVLTILLFFSLTSQLLAGNVSSAHRLQPVIELPPRAEALDRIDSRLCLVEKPAAPPQYAAEFAFVEDLNWAHAPARNTRRAAPVREPEPEFVWDETPPAKPAQRTTARAEPELEHWPEIKPTRAAGTPDLQPTVEWLRERLPPTAATGRVVTVSSRSVPVDAAALDLDLLPRRRDGWQLLLPDRRVARNDVPERYVGENDVNPGKVIRARATDDDAFADPGAWGSRTEIALQLELRVPQMSAVNQPGRLELVLRNSGSEAIRRLQVSEPLLPLEIVTGAFPGGIVEEDALQREVLRLRPGREKTLSLEWFPLAAGDRYYQAQVLAEAFVAALVDVTAAEPEPQAEPMEPQPEPEPPPVSIRPRRPVARPVVEIELVQEPQPAIEPEVTIPRRTESPRIRPRPAIACAVRGAPAITAGDVAELVIEVQNTGNTPLNNVRIAATVPEGLRHRHGHEVECVVGFLTPGETRQAVLRMVGDQAGRSSTAIVVNADEPVNAAAQALVTVSPARVMSRSTPPPRSTAPATNACCVCPGGSPVVWIGAAF